MKQEILPTPLLKSPSSSTSMYDLLRSTSQKWFQKPQQPIFAPSINPSPSPSLKVTKTSCQGRFVQLMRQQIQIVCKQYLAKTKSMLQEQAKKIRQLGQLLSNNQEQLKVKDLLINTLQKKINEGIPIKQALLKEEIDQMRHRIRSFQIRIKDLEQNVRALNLGKSQIIQHIDHSVTVLRESYLERLDMFHQGISERVDSIEKMNLGRSLKASVVSHKNSQMMTILKKMPLLESQLEQLRYQVQIFGQKEYAYDNFKIQALKNTLNSINKRLSCIESMNSRGNLSTSKLNLKSSQTTHLTSTQHLKDSKSRFISKYRSMITQRKHKDSFCSNNQDSESQSEVEQTVLVDEQEKMDRFKRVVEEAGLKQPMRIQIDQTGYVRSVETGMYLFDCNGNAFQLTEAQIDELRNIKIIKL